MTAIIHDTRPTRNAIIALLQTKCETRKTARPNISIPQSVKTTATPSNDGEPPGYEEDVEESEQNADPATEADVDSLEATVEEYLGFLPEVLDRLERSLASDALSLWAGFCAFCEECVGVGAEKIVAVVLEPVAGRIEDLEARAERLGLKPDSETGEEIRKGLAESWRVVEERGV